MHDLGLGDKILGKVLHARIPTPALAGARTCATPSWLGDAFSGLLFYYLTSLVVLFGVMLGRDVIKASDEEDSKPFESSLCRFDGGHYKHLCERGYSYDPGHASEVAFFPAYPLVTRAVVWISGWNTEWALLTVSNWYLAGAFVLLHAYVRISRPNAPASFAGFALAAFGLFPTSCFFRMTYSESLLFFVMLLVMIGMARTWPLWLVAVLIGLGTACRPVGVALVLPFLLYLWQRSDTIAIFVIRATLYGPLACWGLLGYAAYQWEAFGDPLAFVKTQTHWRMRPPVSLGEKAMRLATLEPILGSYVPSSGFYWGNFERLGNPLFSLVAANSAIFAGAAGLVGYGAIRRWLDGREILLAAGLLFIPYVTKGYDNSMLSTGRFAAIVPPLYLSLASVLVRLPSPVAAVLLALSGFFLAVYSALFAVGYSVF